MMQSSLNPRARDSDSTTSGTLESTGRPPTLILPPLVPGELLTHPPDSARRDVQTAVAPPSQSPAPSSHGPQASSSGSQHAFESNHDSDAIGTLVVIRRPPNGNASDSESEQDEFDRILTSIDENALLQTDRVNR